MAFKLKIGESTWQVRKGNAGTVILASFSGSGAESSAQQEVERLHAKHNPSQQGRGGSAKREFASMIRGARRPGVDGTSGQEAQASSKQLLRALAIKKK